MDDNPTLRMIAVMGRLAILDDIRDRHWKQEDLKRRMAQVEEELARQHTIDLAYRRELKARKYGT